MLGRFAGGPPRLVSARGAERAGRPGTDEWLDAELVFPSGATGSARCHMAYEERRITCRVIGSLGEATALNFVLPHQDDRVTVRTPTGVRTEELGKRPSYTYQLEALAAHLRHGEALQLDADDALRGMSLIDACYRAAGFRPRPRTALSDPTS